jgi:hypothetical protein
VIVLNQKQAWHGVIATDWGDSGYLIEMGVKLGPYDAKTHEFRDCYISEEATSKLDEYWGSFPWRSTFLKRSSMTRELDSNGVASAECPYPDDSLRPCADVTSSVLRCTDCLIDTTDWHNLLCDTCANVLCKNGVAYPSICEYMIEMPCPHATVKKEDGIIDRIWCNKTGKQCVCTFIWNEYGCPMKELMSSRYVDCPGCLDGCSIK